MATETRRSGPRHLPTWAEEWALDSDGEHLRCTCGAKVVICVGIPTVRQKVCGINATTLGRHLAHQEAPR